MKRYGRASLSEFLDDFIVYRNLIPVDTSLPALVDIAEELGIKKGVVPRKTSEEYALVMVQLLQAARKMELTQSEITRIVMVGDTLMNDGTAFRNICRVGGWQGIAFIGSERKERKSFQVEEYVGSKIYISNRWSGLQEFNHFCRQNDFEINGNSAVLVDIDKTAVGARGRNDKVIDEVRVQAAIDTASSLLGEDYDPNSFQDSYQRINRPEFHPFTTDNQDYLVYICLILGSDIITLDVLVDKVNSGEMSSFDQFVSYVDAHSDKLKLSLRAMHEEVYALVKSGDPTPFKAFRYNEYLTTITRMGQLGKNPSVSEMLTQEIVITQEVREAALSWREQGAFIFGLSDKPDEASIPTPELASKGYKPIHQVETDVVGE